MMQWLELGLFVGLILAVALYGLTVSGHFPFEHRREALRSTAGASILWGTLALAVAALAIGLRFAWLRFPIATAVIGGGLAVLFAPLMLQPLPDRFVDGRGALIAFSGLAIVLAAISWARV